MKTRKSFVIFFLILNFILNGNYVYAKGNSSSKDIKTDTINEYTTIQGKEGNSSNISRKEVSEIEIDSTNGDIESVTFKDATGVFEEKGISSEYVVVSRQSENCNEESCPTFTVEASGENVVVKEDNINMLVTEPIKIENSKIMINVQGQTEVVISPSKIKQLIESSFVSYDDQTTDIGNIELGSCKSLDGPEQVCTYKGAIYTVDIEKQNKFLGIVPIKADIRYIFSASNGNILEENLPWYLKYFPIMFK